MTEQIFFEHDDVKVTSSRFISGGQTYAMSNVTSVKAYEKKPSRFWGIATLIIGLLITVNSFTPGIIIMIVAGIHLYFQKTVFHVLLSTAAGETNALVTYQRDYLNKVMAALNDAIVSHG